MKKRPPAPSDTRWLLLIYQVPSKPPYLRVKIARRLQKVGAIPVKPTVYVLPKGDSGLEDFQWVVREVSKEGGDATLCEARFVEGIQDKAIERMFKEARAADYQEILQAARVVAVGVQKGSRDGDAIEVELARLKRRMTEVVVVDFFGASGRDAAERALSQLENKPASKASSAGAKAALDPSEFRRRTWVTRKGIYVDRIASAWLIRRFIDPQARFRFVPGKDYEAGKGELCFDMFEGEFTHVGDACTFEVLLERMGLGDPALRTIGEIVHDIDLKDGKFKREEAAGLDRLVAGICMTEKNDLRRLSRGSTLFEDLYGYFHRKQR
jgi:hypothetical protein